MKLSKLAPYLAVLCLTLSTNAFAAKKNSGQRSTPTTVIAEGTLYNTGSTCQGTVRDEISLYLTIVVNGQRISVTDQEGFNLKGSGARAGFTVKNSLIRSDGVKAIFKLGAGKIKRDATTDMDLRIKLVSPSGASCAVDYSGRFNLFQGS